MLTREVPTRLKVLEELRQLNFHGWVDLKGAPVNDFRSQAEVWPCSRLGSQRHDRDEWGFAKQQEQMNHPQPTR